MDPTTNTYDQFTDIYADMMAGRDETDPITSTLLTELGPVTGLRVLDAGCGEGHLARILSRHGATVTAIDVAPRLIDIARSKDPDGIIDYRVGDLSKPQPGLEDSFDVVGSDLVLNDVPDYVGFTTTLASVTKSGGRVVLSMNNPYSYVIRQQVPDYFASGFAAQYRGMSEAGLKVYFYHRTLQDYITVFTNAGFVLTNLLDVPHTITGANALLPAGSCFPYFLVLGLVRR